MWLPYGERRFSRRGRATVDGIEFEFCAVGVNGITQRRFLTSCPVGQAGALTRPGTLDRFATGGVCLSSMLSHATVEDMVSMRDVLGDVDPLTA